MVEMAHRRSSGKICYPLAIICFVLSAVLGCGRQHSEATALAEQNVPFHLESQSVDNEGTAPAVPPDVKEISAAPFHVPPQAQVLPAGTLLTVQLQTSLSAASHAGDSFSAAVAEPFTRDGNTIVDRGSAVAGRIDSVRIDSVRLDGSALASPRGYFELSLDRLTVAGRTFELRTSSLYARANLPASNPSTPGVRIPSGRRLTFRLTAPVTIDNQMSSSAVRKPLASAVE